MISDFIAEPNCGQEIIGDINPSVISSQKLTCLTLLTGLHNLQSLKFVVLPLLILSDSFTHCKLRNGKFSVSMSCWLPQTAHKCLFYLTQCWQEPATGFMPIFPPSPRSNVRLACGTIIFLEHISTAVPQRVCANRSELHKHLSEWLIGVKKLKCSTAQSSHIKGVLHKESLTILCHENKLHELLLPHLNRVVVPSPLADIPIFPTSYPAILLTGMFIMTTM